MKKKIEQQESEQAPSMHQLMHQLKNQLMSTYVKKEKFQMTNEDLANESIVK